MIDANERRGRHVLSTVLPNSMGMTSWNVASLMSKVYFISSAPKALSIPLRPSLHPSLPPLALSPSLSLPLSVTLTPSPPPLPSPSHFLSLYLSLSLSLSLSLYLSISLSLYHLRVCVPQMPSGQTDTSLTGPCAMTGPFGRHPPVALAATVARVVSPETTGWRTVAAVDSPALTFVLHLTPRPLLRQRRESPPPHAPPPPRSHHRPSQRYGQSPTSSRRAIQVRADAAARRHQACR